MNTPLIDLGALRSPDRSRRILIVCCFLLLSLGLLARYQLLNGFSVLPGDRYDVVISTTILEHWYHVFLGQASWSEVNYFYPYTRTIAQTDAFALIGAAYFPFRLLGLDPFMAAEWANFTVRAIGFVSTYLLLRKAFTLPFYWAVLGAVLFTISNGLSAHSSRVQLVAVAFAPLVSLLLWNAIKALLEGNGPRFARQGLAGGGLYGAWCLTCFYIAWFFAYFCIFAFAIMLLWCGSAVRRQLGRQLAAQWRYVLLVLAGTAVAMAPFVYAFLPKSQEVGVREYASVFANTIPWQNVLQVGHDNLILGKLYNAVLGIVSPGYSPVGEYANTGIALILFFLFGAGCIQILRQARRGGAVVLPALVLTTLLTWALALRFGNYSGWYVIYHFFPGAKALNVVAIYQLFLALPVVVIALRFLATRRVALPLGVLLAALLVAEELNKPYLNLDRLAEIERVRLIQAPPPGCRVFYVSGWAGQDTLGGFPPAINNAYAHNVSAMLVAQDVRLPTINGVASFSPKGWNLGEPHRPDYDNRVFIYAGKHGIDKLCKLDLNTKQWRMISAQEIADGADSGRTYYRKDAWQANILAESGLSFVEPWGVWSQADAVSLTFSRPLPPAFSLRLRAHAFGSNAGKEFTLRVGAETRRFVLGASTEDKVIEFTNPGAASTLSFGIPSPVSPRTLGMGDDERRLGIGIVELRIVPR